MAKDYTNIKEDEYGVIKLFISDYNPIFSQYDTFRDWINELKPRRLIIQPTGFLQRHSLALNREKEGEQPDLKKLKKEAQVKERQTQKIAMTALYPLTQEPAYCSYKVKSPMDLVKTPAFNLDKLNNYSLLLEAALKKRGVVFERYMFPAGGSVKPTEAMRAILGEDKHLVDKLKEEQTLFIQNSMEQLSPKHLYDPNFKLADFIINPLNIPIPRDMKDQQVFETVERLIMCLPFSAVVNDEREMPEYTANKNELAVLLKNKIHEDKFSALVKTISQLRSAPPLSTRVKDYLLEEIPLIMLDVKAAIEVYKKTGKKTALCYPTGEGLQGSLVFDFVFHCCDALGLKYQAAFDIVDIAELLKQQPKPTEEKEGEQAPLPSRMSLRGMWTSPPSAPKGSANRRLSQPGP